MEIATTKALERWKSRFDAALLEFLIFNSIYNHPRYGGEIIAISREKLSSSVKVPTVYAILKRSIAMKLIEKLDNIQEEKAIETRGTPRQYYDLTSEGILFYQQIRKELSSYFADQFFTHIEEEEEK